LAHSGVSHLPIICGSLNHFCDHFPLLFVRFFPTWSLFMWNDRIFHVSKV